MAESEAAISANEVLSKFGNIDDMQLFNIIDPLNDDGEIILVKPSPYYGISSLPSQLRESNIQLNILSFNSQSLNAKFDELKILLETAHIQNIRFHVICIQETWLGPNYDLSLLQMEGYRCFSQHKRPECSNHGGLIKYVDEKFDACRLDMANISTLWENLFVVLKGVNQNKDIIIDNIYKPPKDNYNVKNFRTFTAEIREYNLRFKGNK